MHIYVGNIHTLIISLKWKICTSEMEGENTISMILGSIRKHSQLSSPSGTRCPIIKGRYLPRHHSCEAVYTCMHSHIYIQCALFKCIMTKLYNLPHCLKLVSTEIRLVRSISEGLLFLSSSP